MVDSTVLKSSEKKSCSTVFEEKKKERKNCLKSAQKEEKIISRAWKNVE